LWIYQWGGDEVFKELVISSGIVIELVVVAALEVETT